MCKVCWCNNKPTISGKGYCRYHYDQIRKYGYILNERPKGNRNEYVCVGDYTELRILNKDETIKLIALVDNDMVDILKQYSFRGTTNKDYIRSVANGKTIYLHQIVLGKKLEAKEIDHINRNKLDNRKSNLRLVSHKVNANNISVDLNYGIYKTKRNLTKPYLLRIKNKYIGYYKTFEEANKMREYLLPSLSSNI